MELRAAAMELQEENLALRERVKLLELDLQQRRNLKHERALYWMEGDKVPFCPHCRENSDKLVHLFGPFDQVGPHHKIRYDCYTCHHDFYARGDTAFRPDVNTSVVFIK